MMMQVVFQQRLHFTYLNESAPSDQEAWCCHDDRELQKKTTFVYLFVLLITEADKSDRECPIDRR